MKKKKWRKEEKLAILKEAAEKGDHRSPAWDIPFDVLYLAQEAPTGRGSRFSFCIRATHKGLENGKENAAVGGHFSAFLNLVGFYAQQSIFGECRK